MNKIEYKQRAYDGKWMKLVQEDDVENFYGPFINQDGKPDGFMPTRWVIADVYDSALEMIEKSYD